MIAELKKVFKSLIIYDDTSPEQRKNYRWYKTEDNLVIGIEKQEMDEKAERMLSIFLSPLSSEPETRRLTELEQFWHSLIFKPDERADALNGRQNLEGPFQLILFHLKKATEEKVEFEEAVKNLFSVPLTFLWENNRNGIFILSESETKADTVLFHEITDTLTSDFYTDVSLFVGEHFREADHARTRYDWDKKAFECVRKAMPNHQVYYHYHAIPYLFLEDAPVEVSTRLHQLLPGEDELTQTIKVYLESNMNLSLASKKLYMHRNTVQYRIDKFIEKTGIDIKDFHGAVTAYLAILNTKASQKD